MSDESVSGFDFLLAPPRPDIPVEINSLILALGRAQMTRAEWERRVSDVGQEYVSGAVDRAGHTFVLWNWMSLWFGCLAVVAEGFDNACNSHHGLRDQRLSDLLTSPNRGMLRGYRNKIFHPEPYSHEYIVRVLKELHDFVPWARELTDEFIRCFRSYLTI